MDSALMFGKPAAPGNGEKIDRVRQGSRPRSEECPRARPRRQQFTYGAAKLLPHQHERIGAGRNALPGAGSARGETPGPAAAAQQQPVGIEPPRRETEPGDRGIASGLYRDLLAFAAGG